jgi:hypothetical protein
MASPLPVTKEQRAKRKNEIKLYAFYAYNAKVRQNSIQSKALLIKIKSGAEKVFNTLSAPQGDGWIQLILTITFPVVLILCAV